MAIRTGDGAAPLPETHSRNRNLIFSVILIAALLALIWGAFTGFYFIIRKKTVSMYQERQYTVMQVGYDILNSLEEQSGDNPPFLNGMYYLEMQMADLGAQNVFSDAEKMRQARLNSRLVGYGNAIMIFDGRVVYVSGSFSKLFQKKGDRYFSKSKDLKSYLESCSQYMKIGSARERVKTETVRIRGVDYLLTAGRYHLYEKDMIFVMYADETQVLKSYDFFRLMGWYGLGCLLVSLAVAALGLALVRGIRREQAVRQGLEATTAELARFKTMADNANVGAAVLDADNCIMYTNQTFAEMHGYLQAAILGRDVEMFHPPEQLEQIQVLIRSAREQGGMTAQEVDRLHRNGGVFPTLMTAATVPDSRGGAGFLAISAVDITEQKFSEIALKQSEEEFRLLFESARDAIFWADAETGIIIKCNAAAEKLLGLPRHEIIGKHQSFMHPPEQEAYYRNMFFEHVSEAGDSEAQVVTRTGAVVDIHISASVARIGGDTLIQGIFRDITDIKAAHREKELLLEQLNQSQKMEAIGQLAGGVAHDFNNILAVMTGYSELALRNLAEDDPNTARIEKVLKMSMRARDLTMKLLTFARKEKLQVRSTTADAIIAEVRDMLERRINKKISIHTDLERAPAPLCVDVNQIIQALLNLCINACDSMPDGGRLDIRTRTVDLSPQECSAHPYTHPGPHCRIRIKDNGAGISDEIRNKIFEPFFTTKKEGHGTGLGLSVTLGIIENHDGGIDVQSSPGQGAVVDVFLPVRRFEDAIQHQDPMPPAPESGACSILLIDDNTDFLDMMQTMIGSLGYRVTVVDSGARGIELFRQNPGAFDLVVLDMIMPDRDGAEVFEELVRMDPDVNVIICSGYSVEGRAGEVLAQGARAFLQKPFDIRELHSLLNRILADIRKESE